ncbi:MAG: type-F conjugative transfer system pilin assembly protein TrbC [Oligoflexia bacterium]|nr:type-F conjugative transfer system pilin assembly protein TrbC [Oligoflexia bacterium]
MKIILIIFFLLLSAPGLADGVDGVIRQYEEPSTELLDRQKETINKVFSQTEIMTKDKKFNMQLEKERTKLNHPTISAAEITAKDGFNIPEFISNERNRNYLSSVIASADAIIASKATDTDKVQEPPMVFVTFAMPATELRLLIEEASKIGASVIVRGLYKDFKSTIAKIKELSTENGISIDPTLFKKYQVKQVPTFVMPISSKDWVTATGSVSFRYFLELVIKTGKTEEVLVAKNWMAKL